MLFNTWTFGIFLLATFSAYYFLPGRVARGAIFQVTLLTVASYIFYAYRLPWLIFLLAASTAINAEVARRLLDLSKPEAQRRMLLTVALVANLGALAFFKYASLLATTFLPPAWRGPFGFNLSQIPLPIGISFYTFQGISLVVDLYRGGAASVPGLTVPVTRSENAWFNLRIWFFKAFFPQLVAGPIVKAHEFIGQVGAKRFADIDWNGAVKNLILGYFLKMVVADNLREVTASLTYPYFIDQHSINLCLLLFGFSMQIFADFCGYTRIAMGLAILFGYRLPENFNFPYLSRSITEFWRRWHISLSSWLREYLYFPLGGNRRGPVRTYVNLLVVMLLGGLWHGAAWSYMIWGGAHGLCLATERVFGVTGRTDQPFFGGGFVASLVTLVRVGLTFVLVSLLWLLFKLPRFSDVLVYLHCLVHWKAGVAFQGVFVVLLFSVPVLAYHAWGILREGPWPAFRARRPRTARWAQNAAYAFMLFLIVTNSGLSGDFIYFQF